MELELYAIFYCVKQLITYLMGKQFTVKTDHNNLVHLANFFDSKVGPLERRIPGKQTVVADGLTRVMNLSSVEIPATKRHMFVEDRILRIFWLGGEGMIIAEKPGDIERDDEI